MDFDQLDPRMLSGGLGLFFLLAGVRSYKFAIRIAGFLVGAWGGLSLAEVAKAPDEATLGAAIGLGLVGVFFVGLAESIAVRLLGALAFAGLGPPLSSALGIDPTVATLVTGGMGLLVFPLIYRKIVLPVVMGFIGAWLIADALSRGDQPMVVAGLFAIGLLANWAGRKKD